MSTPTSDIFSSRRTDMGKANAWSPDRAALLIIDMVNDCCSEGGSMVLPQADLLFPKITALADGVRDAGGSVFWICDEHDDESDPEFRKRSPHCMKGSWGSRVADALSPRPTDIIRPKHTYSAFHGTDLDDRLRSMGVETVIVCGVVTNICVRSTTHDAFFSGYDVYVVSDACAGTSIREHESSLYDMDTHFADVRSTAELFDAMKQPVG